MNQLRMRILAALAFAGLTASAFAQSAPAARTFSGYYFFGDSLTDSGNLFALTGSPPAPYYQGRVSNGPTYAEYVAPGLLAAVTAPAGSTKLNFAFAGATATTGVTSPPNISMQLAMYQARGIASNPNSLYVLLAGANDLLNAVSVPANQNANAMTGFGVGASTAVAGAVQSLAGLGAKNILVLGLPDISKTPRFTTGSGAPASSLMQTAVTAYNNDLKGRIAGLGLAADVNVTVFDLGSIFQAILANPQRFGFTITNQEYLGILQAGGNPGDVNNYVFWDGIHPTTKTHQLFASVLGEVLNPEFVLGTAATQGTAALAASDLSSDAIASRLDSTRAAIGRHDNADGYVSFNQKSGGYDVASYQNAFDFDGNAITAGFDLNLSKDLLVGAAVSAENISAKLASGAGTFRLRGQLVTAYAQWKSGSFFADASASLGSHDVKDIRRTTAFSGLMTTGKADGNRYGASLRAGFDFGSDTMRITPFAGLRYAKAKLDGYSETGVAGMNYSYNGQSAKSVDGLIGATADWSIGTKNLPMVIGVTAVYQNDFGDDTRQLTGKLADTVSARSSISVRDGLGETIKLGFHLGGIMSKRWGWNAGYTSDFRKNGDTASQYSVSLATGF